MTKMTFTPEPFGIDIEIVKTAPNCDDLDLIFEGKIPHWGTLRSYQLGIFKDCKPAKTVRFYDMGVYKIKNGELKLKFQMTDTNPETGVEHQYALHGEFQFLPLEIIETTPIDWPPVPLD